MTEAPKIRIRNLYKIFGATPSRMVPLVQDGLDKAALLERMNHVLGLQDINIDIHAGQVTVIMGLSGSGKSTLIRHLNRLVDPTSGAILVDGQDITTYSHGDLVELRRTKMSMVFQGFGLMPHQTILQNAALPLLVRGLSAAEAEKQARQWLTRVGLEGFETRYPYQLSGGMQQRVGIARALTSNADIMLMDEAFSALDPLIRKDMQDLLLELQKELKKTVVFITHDLDEALRLADHLVILKDGRIVQQGDPQQIVLNPADDYVNDFVRDINRAKVIRVRSVMSQMDPGISYCGDICGEANLERLIAASGGNPAHQYRVIEQGEPVGRIQLLDALKALLPHDAAPRH
ncbi:MAG: betaine/proline/choline family ABC transporter ATP-binding protein [Rhodobacteraceae bacterium]|nr:betaine/proline/choline family ABC transporter ATP-binding protein [Paracoccaceae bacterium]